MARVLSGNPHADQPFGLRVSEVQIDTADGTTGEINVAAAMSLPQGTVAQRLFVQAVEVDAGATTVTVDLENPGGGGQFLNGSSDNLGTLWAQEAANTTELGNLNTALAAGAVAINAEITIGGTATGSTRFLICCECGRSEY